MSSKTPDEVKKGLDCHSQPCGCELGCPYLEECREDEGVPACRDALVYIQQLEADNAQYVRCIENLTDKLNATNEALPRWISVEERLPEKHTGVIACCEDGYIAPMVYDGRHWNWNGKYEDSVTHWMPLPEPPKEE